MPEGHQPFAAACLTVQFQDSRQPVRKWTLTAADGRRKAAASKHSPPTDNHFWSLVSGPKKYGKRPNANLQPGCMATRTRKSEATDMRDREVRRVSADPSN